jgi:hypothetical protein
LIDSVPPASRHPPALGCAFHTSSDPCPSSGTMPDPLHVGQRLSSSVPWSTMPSPLHSGQIFSVIFLPFLVPPPRDQPAALIRRHAVFLDRLLDRALLVGGFRRPRSGYPRAVRAWAEKKKRRFAFSTLFFARNTGMSESTHFIIVMLQTSHTADPVSCAGVFDIS